VFGVVVSNSMRALDNVAEYFSTIRIEFVGFVNVFVGRDDIRVWFVPFHAFILALTFDTKET